MVKVHTVHGQLLSIFQEVNLCFSWCHPPDWTGRNRSDMQGQQAGIAKGGLMLSDQCEYEHWGSKTDTNKN